MTDIFVSYASGDRERIAPLVETFKAQGWSVWWDRHIVPGTSFDDMIEQAISQAACVVVAWTEASITSEWVRREALFGLDKDILVPVLLDDIELPFAFHRTQAAKLFGSTHPEQASGDMEHLLQGIRQTLGSIRGATQPSSQFKGGANDIREVGRTLAVRYVLEGSIRKVGGNIRVVAQLIEAESGGHIWANTFNESIEDIETTQDSLTQRISNAVASAAGSDNFQRILRTPRHELGPWGLLALAPIAPSWVTLANVLQRHRLISKIFVGIVLSGRCEHTMKTQRQCIRTFK